MFCPSGRLVESIGKIWIFRPATANKIICASRRLLRGAIGGINAGQVARPRPPNLNQPKRNPHRDTRWGWSSACIPYGRSKWKSRALNRRWRYDLCRRIFCTARDRFDGPAGQVAWPPEHRGHHRPGSAVRRVSQAFLSCFKSISALDRTGWSVPSST